MCDCPISTFAGFSLCIFDLPDGMSSENWNSSVSNYMLIAII